MDEQQELISILNDDPVCSVCKHYFPDPTMKSMDVGNLGKFIVCTDCWNDMVKHNQKERSNIRDHYNNLNEQVSMGIRDNI